MAKVFDQIPNSIVEEAIAWYLQLNSTQTESGKKAKFETWIAQDASHAMAYERIERIFQPIKGVDVKAAEKSIVSILQTESKQRKRKNMRGVAFGITMFASLYFGYQSTPVKVMLADNKTEIGEIKTLTLPDQSVITMNTNTALDIQFDQDKRMIKLYKGEVFVNVSKDASRPFLVITEHGDARALGTQYNVDKNVDSTHVVVIESKVEVCSASPKFSYKILNSSQRKCTVLHQSQGVKIGNQTLDDVQEIDANAISGWVTGTIVIDNQPLTEVLVELQRYSPEKIIFSASELNHIKVSGVLPVNNIPHAFDILADQFNLQIKQVDSKKIEINSQR